MFLNSIVNIILKLNFFIILFRRASPSIFIQPLKHQCVSQYATEADSKERIPAPGKDAEVNPRIASLVDQITSLTLIETSELVQLLKVTI
jgi:hypothetical protein